MQPASFSSLHFLVFFPFSPFFPPCISVATVGILCRKNECFKKIDLTTLYLFALEIVLYISSILRYPTNHQFSPYITDQWRLNLLCYLLTGTEFYTTMALWTVHLIQSPLNYLEVFSIHFTRGLKWGFISSALSTKPFNVHFYGMGCTALHHISVSKSVSAEDKKEWN